MRDRDVIFHNPRCSKSRETLALLDARGVKVQVVEYLKEPPSAEELDALCRAMDLQPVQLIRAKEPRFAELKCSLRDKRSRREWLELLAANPVLIERPIVSYRGKAALGRPPENVLKIL